MMRGLIPAFMPPLTVKQDPDIFKSGMAALFARNKPSVVITSATCALHIPSGPYNITLVTEIPDLSKIDADVTSQIANIKPDTTAFLQHSSGTTGLKKGVVLSHNTVIDQIYRYAQSIGAKSGDTIASWLPLYHDMGLITSFLLPTVIGCPIISIDALEWVMRPTILLDAIERYKVAFAWQPNFAFHHLLRATRPAQSWDLHSLKAIINCSEPCRADTFNAFAARFASMGVPAEKLQVCYAMAETVFAATQTPVTTSYRVGSQRETAPFLSSGIPISGVELEIRDNDGNILPDRQIGEICIKSSMMFDEYYLQPLQTAERLRGGWYHTNDLGCIEDGQLYVLGRIDDLLIINGKNLFAHEVESAISELVGVAPGRVLAISEFDPGLGASRLLILTERDGSQIDAKTLQDAIRQTVLANTGIFPGSVQFLDRGFLVKSSSGKIARAQSLQKYRNVKT